MTRPYTYRLSRIPLAEKIAHIREHQQGFDDLQTGVRDVGEYFEEYSCMHDLYERVCRDLKIEPRQRRG